MFHRAMTLVKALSSTSSWYSSGPMTWRMCRLPSASGAAREAQNRAVSRMISAPAERKNSSSPLARQSTSPDRMGDVGADMLFHHAAEDVDLLAVSADDMLGRRFPAGVGGFPGVERAPETHSRGLGARGGQRVIAVHEHCPRGRRPDRSVEGQQIDLGVPEDVAEIGISRESPCAYRHTLVFRVRGACQVVDREADRALQVVVAVDDDVGDGPLVTPGGFMGGRDGAPTLRTTARQSGPRCDRS